MVLIVALFDDIPENFDKTSKHEEDMIHAKLSNLLSKVKETYFPRTKNLCR